MVDAKRRPQVPQPLCGPQLGGRPALVLGSAGKYLPLLDGVEFPELGGGQIAKGAVAAIGVVIGSGVIQDGLSFGNVQEELAIQVLVPYTAV